MKNFCLVLATALIILANSYAFGQTNDIKGWNKALWGMTENEVLDTFKGKATVIKIPVKEQGLSGLYDSHARITLDGVEIGAQKYKTDFVFDDKEKRLVKVIIRNKYIPFPEQFLFLEKMLIEKYRTPVHERRHGASLHRMMWLLPSTVIELRYYNYGATEYSPAAEGINIIYKKKEDLENL